MIITAKARTMLLRFIILFVLCYDYRRAACRPRRPQALAAGGRAASRCSRFANGGAKRAKRPAKRDQGGMCKVPLFFPSLHLSRRSMATGGTGHLRAAWWSRSARGPRGPRGQPVRAVRRGRKDGAAFCSDAEALLPSCPASRQSWTAAGLSLGCNGASSLLISASRRTLRHRDF